MIEWLSENALWLGVLGAIAAIIALFTPFLKKNPEGDKVTAKNGSVTVGGDIIGAIITPDNVAVIVSLVGAAVGVTTTAISGIQVWVEEKKSRKIRVRYKEFEIEITGSHTRDDIASKLQVFRELKEELDQDEVKIEVTGDR